VTDKLVSKIRALCKERNAVILAHNYQRDEVQDIGDYVGDSLELSRTAAKTDAEIIVFCGVHFMAETAAVLCPGKIVLMPDENAGCPMADMITPRELKQFKEQHPGAAVVTYVNSSAAVKALSDVCCTSANAVEIVDSFPKDREIIFIPDRNLGSYAAKQTGRNLILWKGYCPSHQRITPEHIKAERRAHPEAKVVVHPECRPAVVDMADAVASTSGMLKFCKENKASEFIIGTETGMLHRLEVENPGKRFYAATGLADCPDMKLVTLEKILWCLEDMAPRVDLPSEIAARARAAIERMLSNNRR
jgi:quinolinate synthase